MAQFQPQRQQRPWGFQPQMFRGPPGQVLDGNGAPGTASLKIPPYWSPELEREYPFRFWAMDVTLWNLATDLDANRRGAALILRLGGAARSMARELPQQNIQNGGAINTAQGPQQVDAVAFIVHGLSRRFAPTEEEGHMRAISDLMGFRRVQGESLDTAFCAL